MKETVMNHYGGKCACCGEGEIVFLTIDHVNNDGAAHRRQLRNRGQGGGLWFYRWLIKHGYPASFQVLCLNCNLAKHVLGVCPHQHRRDQHGS